MEASDDRAPSGAVTSMNNSQHVKRLKYSELNIPEEIWYHIHSLMPLRDAARAACVSRVFQRSWRCYPNLILTRETTGSFILHKVLKNHSGNGVKNLQITQYDDYDFDSGDLDNWLHMAIAPGIENITLSLPLDYSFPCSLLSYRNGISIRCLDLSDGSFHPTVDIGCMRSLTKLVLSNMCITDDELGCLLSKSPALKQLELSYCEMIICLKIPCSLEQLSFLNVSSCRNLKMIESKAPNLSTFMFSQCGDGIVELSFQQSSQVKDLDMHNGYSVPNILSYAITKIPYIFPNLTSLTLLSSKEELIIPMAAAKFPHVKHLKIYLIPYPYEDFGQEYPEQYDYLSLVSFLDACPVVQTFFLAVDRHSRMEISIFQNPSDMRQMPERKHGSLKNVTILGFGSSKSMVELACHVLENATSLESMALDTIYDNLYDKANIGRCCTTSAAAGEEIGRRCVLLSRELILQAHSGLQAIECYVRRKVPDEVDLTVHGPCFRCHALE